MDFLTLCQEFVKEHGIAGNQGNPTSVVNQTGELGNVVRWIRDADSAINNLWTDWRFLWLEHEVDAGAATPGLPAASQTPTGPTSFSMRKWDTKAFWLNYGSSSPKKLTYMPWDEFRAQYPGSQTAGQPSVITVKPDRSLRVDRPADQNYSFHGEGWRRPSVLSTNTQSPMMPSEFHRIIVVRASIYYGNREDAPEIISGAEAEYLELLDKLQASELPSFEFERMSQADEDLSIAVPGYDEGSGLGVTR